MKHRPHTENESNLVYCKYIKLLRNVLLFLRAKMFYNLVYCEAKTDLFKLNFESSTDHRNSVTELLFNH